LGNIIKGKVLGRIKHQAFHFNLYISISTSLWYKADIMFQTGWKITGDKALGNKQINNLRQICKKWEHVKALRAKLCIDLTGPCVWGLSWYGLSVKACLSSDSGISALLRSHDTENMNTLRKKGFYIWSIGFFTQLQRTFYAKKRFYNDKKEPFWL